MFTNTENTIKYFGEKMIERGIKPELEVFDKSMIDMALRLHRKDYILTPADKPEAVFAVAEGDKAVAVYEYCNLHGLWKVEL